MARRRSKPMSEINVVPYIDVMLVLLIIFMVTAPLLTQGVKVELPKAAAKPIKNQRDQDFLVVSISIDGNYYLERGRKQEKAEDLKFVRQYISKLLEQAPDTQVLIRGDTQVPYGRVVQLMSALQSAGAGQLGLVTDPTQTSANR